MSLTVLSVAYPLAPVGDVAVGGAELVLSDIDAALVRARHRSLVVAMGGSAVAGTLLATPRRKGVLTEVVQRAARASCRGAIEPALRRFLVDVVRPHGVDSYEYLPPPGAPP